MSSLQQKRCSVLVLFCFVSFCFVSLFKKKKIPTAKQQWRQVPPTRMTLSSEDDKIIYALGAALSGQTDQFRKVRKIYLLIYLLTDRSSIYLVRYCFLCQKYEKIITSENRGFDLRLVSQVPPAKGNNGVCVYREAFFCSVVHPSTVSWEKLGKGTAFHL